MSWLRPEHSRSSNGGGGSSGGGSSKPAPVDYAAQFQGLLSNPSAGGIMGLLSSIPQFAGLLGGLGQQQTPPPQPGGAGSLMAPATGSTFGQVQDWIGGLPSTAPPLSTASSAFSSAFPTITKDLYATPKKK